MATNAPSIAAHELDKPYLLRGARIRAFIMTSLLSVGMEIGRASCRERV